MKLIPTKCPNCGASIEIDATKDAYRCEYCHTTFTDEDFKRVEINQTITNRTVDEAKIREQDANIEKHKTDRIMVIVLAIFWILYSIYMLITKFF